MQAPGKPPVQNSAAIVEALKEVGGSDAVRSLVGSHPDSGEPLHQPGYRLYAGGMTDGAGANQPMYEFVNGIGQTVQVPAHRVDPVAPRDGRPPKKAD